MTYYSTSQSRKFGFEGFQGYTWMHDLWRYQEYQLVSWGKGRYRAYKSSVRGLAYRTNGNMRIWNSIVSGTMQAFKRLIHVIFPVLSIPVSILILQCSQFLFKRWKVCWFYDCLLSTCLATSFVSYSERILGKAIKALALPRDEIVVMTKVW